MQLLTLLTQAHRFDNVASSWGTADLEGMVRDLGTELLGLAPRPPWCCRCCTESGCSAADFRHLSLMAPRGRVPYMWMPASRAGGVASSASKCSLSTCCCSSLMGKRDAQAKASHVASREHACWLRTSDLCLSCSSLCIIISNAMGLPEIS